MCGRFTLSTPAAKLIELFQLTGFPRWEPRYNIAPTQLVICVRMLENIRQAMSMKWGLVPSWAKDASIGSRMINARSETAAEKPSFRKAWSRRRCLIPVDGFYEWEKLPGRKKQPWLIHMADRQPFAFAGLWEIWHPKDSSENEELFSCTILTTSANADMQPIHDRMPVIVPPEHFGTWLSDSASAGQLAELTQPFPDGTLERYRVSNLVNKPTTDAADCVSPLPADLTDSTQSSTTDQMSLFDESAD